MTYTVLSGALNSTPTNQSCLYADFWLFFVAVSAKFIADYRLQTFVFIVLIFPAFFPACMLFLICIEFVYLYFPVQFCLSVSVK